MAKGMYHKKDEATLHGTVAALGKGLAPYARIAVPMAIAIGGYFVYRQMKNSSRSQRNIEEAYKKIGIYDKTLFIDEATASLYAERLFAAMNRNGTDTETIYSVLDSLRTKSDLLAVQKAFGVRYYGFTSENNSWVSKKLGISKALDLNGWLHAELSGKEMRRVEKIYQRLGQAL